MIPNDLEDYKIANKFYLDLSHRLWSYDNIKLNVSNCVLISDNTNASTNNDHISYNIRATKSDLYTKRKILKSAA